MKDERKIYITNYLSLLWWTIGITITCFLLARIRTIFVPLIFSAIVACLVNPLVDLMQKRRISRVVALLICYLGIAGILALIFVYFFPKLIQQFNELLNLLPQKITSAEEFISRYDTIIGSINEPVKSVINNFLNSTVSNIGGYIKTFVSSFTNVLLGFLSQLANVFISLIIAFYLMKDFHMLKENTVSWIPKKHREKILQIFKDLNQVFGAYIRGQVTVCVILTLIATVAFTLFRLKAAFSLGVIVGVFNVIPYFGPIIAAIPVILVASTVSFKYMIVILFVVLGIQQLESLFITPKIMSQSLGLHPVVVIISLLIGSRLLGIAGMILSIPTAAMIKVVLTRLLLKET